MIENTARAAALVAEKEAIGKVLSDCALDRAAAETIGMADFWWDCFWKQFHFLREEDGAYGDR